MFDTAVFFIYASFAGIVVVSIGTVLKPLFDSTKECETCP